MSGDHHNDPPDRLEVRRRFWEQFDEPYERYRGSWADGEDRLPIIDRIESVSITNPLIDCEAAETALMRHFVACSVPARPVRWFHDPESACAYMLGVTVDAAAAVAHLDACGHDVVGDAVWRSVGDPDWLQIDARRWGGERMEYARALGFAIGKPTLRAWRDAGAYDAAYWRMHAREYAWHLAAISARSRAMACEPGTTDSVDRGRRWSIADRIRRWSERRPLPLYSSGTQKFAWNAVLESAQSAESSAWTAMYASIAAYGYPHNEHVRWKRDAWGLFVDAFAAGLFVFWVRDHEVVALSAPSIHMGGNAIHRESGPAIEWSPHRCYYVPDDLGAGS